METSCSVAVWWYHPEQAVCLGPSSECQQQPRPLQILQIWDGRDQFKRDSSVPRTLAPCSDEGKDRSPHHCGRVPGANCRSQSAQTSGSLTSTEIRECFQRACWREMCTSATRQGLHKMYTSSRNANRRSVGSNLWLTASNALCWPTAYRADNQGRLARRLPLAVSLPGKTLRTCAKKTQRHARNPAQGGGVLQSLPTVHLLRHAFRISDFPSTCPAPHRPENSAGNRQSLEVVDARNLAMLPGAGGSPSKAWWAADTSPIWIKLCARSDRCSEGTRRLRLHRGIGTVSAGYQELLL